MPLKIDLHVHTRYSKDSIINLKDLILYSRRNGLDGVAITDHDTLEGTLNLGQTDGLILIPGLEVTTASGHVVALNPSSLIPKGLSLEETVERIHEADGIAIAAHLSSFLKSSLGPSAFKKTTKIDAVEVINSSAFPFFLSTCIGKRLAHRLNLPQTGGSDSHIPETIGLAYTAIDAHLDVDSVVHAIRKGYTIPYGKSVPFGLRFRKILKG